MEIREVKARAWDTPKLTGWGSEEAQPEVRRGLGCWKPGKEMLQGGRDQHTKCCYWLKQDVD